MTEWLGQIRSLIFGADRPWQIDEAGVTGLGVPTPRSTTVERGDRDGDVAGVDVLPRRVLTVPLVAAFASPALAWQACEGELKPAWAESAVDVPLILWLPGATQRMFYGRPRGVDVDLTLLRSGIVRALCTFEALDPFGYSPAATIGAPANVSVGGTAPTDRVTLTIVGNGGVPRVVNRGDGAGDVVFAVPVPANTSRRVDLRTRTVRNVNTGQDAFGELSAATRWFRLRPGVNPILVTGALWVQVEFQPAWR